jgi:hypothetical protein
MSYDGEGVVPLDELDLCPEQERRLRQHVVVRVGHAGREVIDASDWQEWAEYILQQPPAGEGPST